MKHTLLILLLAASTAAASAQTPAQPAASAAKKATPAATAAKSTAKPATTTGATAAKPAAAAKLPLGVPAPGLPPVKTLKKNIFTVALSYQDEVVGTGAEAASGKQAKFKFTLYVAADGHKFDSSDDHPGPPLKDKDGKPVLGDDGKPKTSDPAPMTLVLGQGRPLPGWDYGVAGMKVGGKRRVFIPWQLGFGEREIPVRDATHPATPAKSDLILDVELVDVADAPVPPQHGGGPGGHPPMGAHPPMPGGPGAPPAPSTPAAAPAASAAPAAAPVAPAAAPAASPSK